MVALPVSMVISSVLSSIHIGLVLASYESPYVLHYACLMFPAISVIHMSHISRVIHSRIHGSVTIQIVHVHDIDANRS